MRRFPSKKKEMKLQRIIFTYLFLFVSFQICFAQERDKAILIDEIDRTSCADLQTRVFASLNEALKDSNSKGYIIIYGKKNDLLENLHYESWIKGIIDGSKTQNRVKVIRGKERDKFTVQVWKVPFNSNTEFFTETEWSFVLSKSTKPFVFTNSLPATGLCPISSQVKLFSDFLIANPSALGHLVIYDKTNRNFSSKGKEVLGELVNQYKVPRHRLKLFYKKNKDFPYKETAVEFWLVPQNKK